jgi:hypothetical protein
MVRGAGNFWSVDNASWLDDFNLWAIHFVAGV